MAHKERYRIIYYPPEGKLKVRYIDGLLTKANNLYNRFSAKPGKVTFEVKEAGSSSWKFVKSSG